jgi:hypothetical protein
MSNRSQNTIHLFVVYIFLAVALGISGCAMLSKVLIDEHGRQVECGAMGMGVIGTPAAAIVYQQCVDKYRSLGFMELEEFDQKDGPKVEVRAGLVPPLTNAPVWETPRIWTYHARGTTTFSNVEFVRKENINGAPAYVLRTTEDREVIVNEELNLLQVREKGEIVDLYAQPRQDYSWPLEVGKSWVAEGPFQHEGAKWNYYQTVQVTTFGIVRVPAGEFEAFHIVRSGRDGKRLSELWYAPQAGYHVKIVQYFQQGRTIAELASMRSGKALAEGFP